MTQQLTHLVDVSYQGERGTPTMEPDANLERLIDHFATSLADMPDKFLACRDIQHPWRVARDYHIVDANHDSNVNPRMGYAIYVQRLFICTRCGMQRSDAYVIDTTSRWQGLTKIGSSSYRQPKGFPIKGTGRMSGKKDLVRGEAFRRIIDKLPKAN